MAKDPVCGMNVTTDSKGGTTQWQGETHAFCSEKCRHKFTEDPDVYLFTGSMPQTRPLAGCASE